MNFASIRAMDGSQQKGFEELVCQLARRSPPSDAKEFRRIEGAGGDGGVEAYWIRNDGRETGYQAKFHLTSRDVNWTELDKSLKNALANHPELDHYVVALPCNLTDRTGKTTRSRTGWQQWETHKEKWESWAAKEGRSVRFEPWTLSELQERLQEPANGGLVRYWFDIPRFDPDWFRDQVDKAVKDLGDRYHPHDHVEVHAADIFDGLVRGTRLRGKLQGLLDQLEHASREAFTSLSKLETAPEEQVTRQLRDAIETLLRMNSAIGWAPNRPWPLDNWIAYTADAIPPFHALQEWSWDYLHKEPQQKSYTELRAEDAVAKLSEALSELHGYLPRRQMLADQRRKALVTGTGGTGKSHLFAHVAELAIAEERPVLLLLGQHFNDSEPWTQILANLGLGGFDRNDLLGALDAAAEARRTRALVLIDALNEGAGIRLWRDRISGFIAAVENYPHIAIAVSCRSEYLEHIVPEGLRKELVPAQCYGFTTAEEQEGAARQYLEKRGITRPATPWMTPEFTNPLFLQACCTSLEREGKTEFPRGIQGTRTVLAFYLKSVGRHLAPRYAGTDELVSPTLQAVANLAANMARNRRDYVLDSAAHDIAEAAFRTKAKPKEQTWLELLRAAGVLRRDPNPDADPQEPIQENDEVIRFAFQRFADHLIAEALLRDVTDLPNMFGSSGPLAFLLERERIAPKWRGVLHALAIQVPEAKGNELVDLLPEGQERWWPIWEIQEGFVESLLYRAPTTFSARTRELFKHLSPELDEIDPQLRILLQLAPVQGHPWNADFLYDILKSRAMPERDALWSTGLALATDTTGHPVHRLIDWAWRADKSRANNETLRLTAFTLTWCFTTSSRPIRDKATKALSAVILERPAIYRTLVEAFAEVDDPYLSERLFASAFGASCAIDDAKDLFVMADVTYSAVFSSGKPPVQLLTRDYCLGIIERAASFGCVPANVDLEICRPPYQSTWPLEEVTEEQLKRVVEKADDKAILFSTSEMGDFGRYEIDSSVGHFTSKLLSDHAPTSKEERLSQFEEQVVNIGTPDRRARFDELRENIRDLYGASLVPFDTSLSKRDRKSLRSKMERSIKKSEEELLALLTEDEVQTYEDLALPSLFPDRVPHHERDAPRVSLQWAQRWVAKRAYELGWTKELFSEELGWRGDLSRDRPSIERIGKKYQWIALDELLAHCADNVWLMEWPSAATKYENPCQLGFQRDIDPTIFSHSHCATQPPDVADGRLKPPPGILPVSDKNLLAWPFKDEEVLQGPDLLEVVDPNGHHWLVLYDLIHGDEKADRQINLISMRRNFFTRVSTIVVPKSDVMHVVEKLKGQRLADPTDWEMWESTDSAYLLEAYWRNTWPENGWSDDGIRALQGIRVLKPLSAYHWESHLDASLPDGKRVLLPASWLLGGLELTARPLCPGEYVNKSDAVFFHNATIDDRRAALIARDAFFNYLDDEGLACIWAVAGERNAWPDGSHENWSRRSHSAVYWHNGKEWVTERWHEDTRRGE